jgi:hypothetical protein
MKKMIVLFAAILSGLSLSAQDDEIQTLFGSGTKISGFGGPFMTFTAINGDFAHMMGGGGGVMLGDFFLGGYGEGLTNYIYADGNEINFGHGGFWTGYSFFGKRAIHPCISAQIGWGGLTPQEGTYYESDNMFIVKPTVELEMNFLKFFRLSVGANYMFATGVNTPGLTDSDFNSPGAFLAFKFGWF